MVVDRGGGGGRRGPGIGFGQSAAPAAAPSPTTGTVAVQAAESARERRLARNEADLAKAQDDMEAAVGGRDDVRAVGGRLFALRDGVWTDAAHSTQSNGTTSTNRVIRVKSFTAAYFELLRALPELEPVLRELTEVVVAGERVSVRIGSEGMESISRSELAELVADFR
jgi:hypothetical protein